MKILSRLTLPAVMLVSLFASNALAKTQYRLDFFGAVNLPQKKDFEITVPQSTVPVRGDQKFSLGGRGGVRLGADGSGHWGQDFIYSYGTNPTTIETDLGSFRFTSRTHQFSTTQSGIR